MVGESRMHERLNGQSRGDDEAPLEHGVGDRSFCPNWTCAGSAPVSLRVCGLSYGSSGGNSTCGADGVMRVVVTDELPPHSPVPAVWSGN